MRKLNEIYHDIDIEEAIEYAKNKLYRYKKDKKITYEYISPRTARLKGYTEESGWKKLIPKNN